MKSENLIFIKSQQPVITVGMVPITKTNIWVCDDVSYQFFKDRPYGNTGTDKCEIFNKLNHFINTQVDNGKSRSEKLSDILDVLGDDSPMGAILKAAIMHERCEFEEELIKDPEYAFLYLTKTPFVQMRENETNLLDLKKVLMSIQKSAAHFNYASIGFTSDYYNAIYTEIKNEARDPHIANKKVASSTIEAPLPPLARTIAEDGYSSRERAMNRMLLVVGICVGIILLCLLNK